MNEQDRNQRIPLSEIVNALPLQPQYVLVIVAENKTAGSGWCIVICVSSVRHWPSTMAQINICEVKRD
ncbi:MAG: hypothetical protein KatS3mg047_1502 [Bellilinea sp.]|nr:MAG: hypothetical protein KatS3mg047_1502 [Bellilinea sp.]